MAERTVLKRLLSAIEATSIRLDQQGPGIAAELADVMVEAADLLAAPPAAPTPPEHDINCGIDPLRLGQDIGCTCYVRFENEPTPPAVPLDVPDEWLLSISIMEAARRIGLEMVVGHSWRELAMLTNTILADQLRSARLQPGDGGAATTERERTERLIAEWEARAITAGTYTADALRKCAAELRAALTEEPKR